jgi:hypothetical protein
MKLANAVKPLHRYQLRISVGFNKDGQFIGIGKLRVHVTQDVCVYSKLHLGRKMSERKLLL